MKRYIRSDIKDLSEEDFRDRLHQAEDFTTSRRTLERLALDSEAVVRQAAERTLHSLDDGERFWSYTGVPDFMFIQFAKALEPSVRWKIALHPETPADILQNLAEDEDPRVRAAARSRLQELQ